VAARAGLRSGDVIYTLNGRRVEDMATLTRLLVQLRTEPLSLEYVRGDNVARLELEAHAPPRR
jgi:S1-C subfamily serine protease